jgi:hypothetical protein
MTKTKIYLSAIETITKGYPVTVGKNQDGTNYIMNAETGEIAIDYIKFGNIAEFKMSPTNDENYLCSFSFKNAKSGLRHSGFVTKTGRVRFC